MAGNREQAMDGLLGRTFEGRRAYRGDRSGLKGGPGKLGSGYYWGDIRRQDDKVVSPSSSVLTETIEFHRAHCLGGGRVEGGGRKGGG